MTLLWMDGLDRYSVSADLTQNYTVDNFTGGVDFLATSGINGGGCVQIDGDQEIRRFFTSTLTAGGVMHAGFWLRITNIPGAARTFFNFETNLQSGISKLNPYLMVNPDFSISVNAHGVAWDSAVVATSAAGTLAQTVYAFVEYAAKWNTSGSGGFIKVWVDGNLVINFSGNAVSGTVPTTCTAAGPALWGNFSTGFRYDDLIIWDEVGTDFSLTSLSTTYIPEIETLSVDGNDTVQFTPLSGSNFQMVDDPAFQDADTTYNFSTTVGHEDLFTVDDMASTPLYVFAVGVKVVWRSHVPSIMTARDSLKSGGTTTYSADRTMTTSYILAASFYGKDPDTSAVWTVSAPDSIKVGYKFQS